MTAEAAPNVRAGLFRAVRIAAGKGCEAARSGSMKATLDFVAVRVTIVFLQPIADGIVENGRNRHFAKTRLAFEIGLEFTG